MSAWVTGVATLAVFLCALTAGFLVAFAVVVMPGIRTLDDAAYLRAFRVMDGVIQNGQPLFMLMWVGSIVATLALMVLGGAALTGPDRLLSLGAGALYVGGVQLPTFIVNIPLNNGVQRLNLDAPDAAQLREARAVFERRWNRANVVRTGLALVSVALMLLLLTRL